MDKKSMLQNCEADYQSMLAHDNLDMIVLHKKDGSRCGIGNPDAKKRVLEALLEEVRKQLNNL